MEIKRIEKYKYLIKGKNVDAVVLTDRETIDNPSFAEALKQIVNVTHLSGIIAAIAMPDIHWGYGFPIGGVGVFDSEEGVISPGGIGFDINCGVRLITTNVHSSQVRPVMKRLVEEIYKAVPVGVGARGPLKMNIRTLREICAEGAFWAVRNGFGTYEDLEHIEDAGKLSPSNPDWVSKKAFERGADEVGTLGSGNHFIEVQQVQHIYDKALASSFGLFEGQTVISLHTGSRGFGHQVATDYIQIMRNKLTDHNRNLPDKQLINAPFSHNIGRQYFNAMNCAANYAFVNRQIITSLLRRVFSKIIPSCELRILYDVAHNIAKVEKYEKSVLVHRKGATRALGPGNELLSAPFKETGQPVLLPGDMGTASYVLVGTCKAEQMTFGSTAHGAGRVLGRREALRKLDFDAVLSSLKEKRIEVMSKGKKTLVEEASEAYKNVDLVVEIVHQLGISMKVARLVPMGVVKG